LEVLGLADVVGTDLGQVEAETSAGSTSWW